MLEVGMKAPDFTLLDKRGNSVSLSDFLGKKVVLYFYPKDSTPGCTRQACAFAQNHSNFEDKNVVVIGVSKDSVASHLKFAEKYELPFVLLSDPGLQAIQAYGVWQEKKLYGKVRVNSISPGWIDTDYTVYEGPDAVQQPAGRVGNPLDIANMVLFLCSDKAGFITGENICIDGGQTRLMIYHNDCGWSYQP